MKTAILLVFAVLLLVTSIEARTLTEKVQLGESVEIENQKVSVVGLDNDDNKVLICVNNVKSIVSEDTVRNINNVRVEVKEVKETYAELKLESSCDDCVLSDNGLCFDDCFKDEDCNDNDENTIDQCLGAPRKCIYTEVIVPEPPKPEPPKEINVNINIEQPPEEEIEEKPFSLLHLIIDFISKLFN